MGHIIWLYNMAHIRDGRVLQDNTTFPIDNYPTAVSWNQEYQSPKYHFISHQTRQRVVFNSCLGKGKESRSTYRWRTTYSRGRKWFCPNRKDKNIWRCDSYSHWQSQLSCWASFTRIQNGQRPKKLPRWPGLNITVSFKNSYESSLLT